MPQQGCPVASSVDSRLKTGGFACINKILWIIAPVTAMYRVSPFVSRFATALFGGLVLATLWVNLAPSSYYDMLEWRIVDLDLPPWLNPLPVSLTPLLVVSHILMPFFVAFIGKEFWEALSLERGAMAGTRALAPLAAVVMGTLAATVVWIGLSGLIETAEEASFGLGWQVPVGADVVLVYVFARMVFGAGHPAVHPALLLAIGFDILGLLLTGLADPQASLRLVWLALPLGAALGVWHFFGKPPAPGASETKRRRGLALWPYAVAAGLSWLGVAASGLPPALGFLPIIPAIPHADRSFGVFAEAEAFLHDPLNRFAHYLVKPLAVVLFLFGLTRGGIDLGAFAPTTLTTLAALWIGKPLGILLGLWLAAKVLNARLAVDISTTDTLLLAWILGMGFTVPVLSVETALQGGGMAEAARLGLALSLAAGPIALFISKTRRRKA